MEDNEKILDQNNEEVITDVIFAELEKLEDRPNKRQLYLGALAGTIGIGAAVLVFKRFRNKKKSEEE